MGILIIYDSWGGHTQRAAEAVAEGVRRGDGEVTLKTADEATRADIQACSGLVTGSPVHQRTMSWPMKRFIDLQCEPAWFWDDCVGRVGGVFTTGGGQGGAGGGCELSQLSMLGNLAALGLVMVPHPKTTPGFAKTGMHWGPHLVTTDEQMAPLAEDQLDPEALGALEHYGENVAGVAARLAGFEMVKGAAWPDEKTKQMRREMEESGMGRPQK